MPERDCYVAGHDLVPSPGASSQQVRPLGIFGILAGQREMEQMRQTLRTQSERIAPGERNQIADYLRRGAIVIALMEHTRDVLADAFEVPGGSAICTDGVYYWRLDAAEYIRHYGIGLPEEFLKLGRGISWLPPSLDREHVLAIDDYLGENIRRYPPSDVR